MPPRGYERHLVPAIFRPWGEVLLARARPQPGERILDVGSATGSVARQAARLLGAGGLAIALDRDPEALEVGSRSAGGRRVRWQEGDAQALPFEDGGFDVVLCQQTLQAFDDAGLALREMNRVLAPGGRLAVSVWHRLEANRVYDILLRTLRQAAARQDPSLVMPGGPLRLGTAGRLRHAVAAAGFMSVRPEVVTLRVSFGSPADLARGYFASAPRGSDVRRLNAAARREVIAGCARRLAPLAAGGPLSFEMASTIVTARAGSPPPSPPRAGRPPLDM